MSPFFGSGSVEFDFINKSQNINTIWINDVDIGISCLWDCVINQPQSLKNLIIEYKPTVEDFYSLKTFLLNTKYMPINEEQILKIGFSKLVLHQISFSGLGVKSGGPLGGDDQNSKYPVDCRWSPKNLCKQIDKLHTLLKRKTIYCNGCTNVDFGTCLWARDSHSVIYLDPPYYEKGNQLYQHGFTIQDHERLCNCLQRTEAKWLLSYDDCPEIRKLYRWAKIEEICANYKIAKNGTKKKELLIYA